MSLVPWRTGRIVVVARGVEVGRDRRKTVPAPIRPLRRRLTSELIEGFYESLDTPVSLSCYMLYVYGEHEQLARKTLDVSRYKDNQAFYLDYLAVRFLTKFTGLETGIDTRAVAVDEFIRCESKCLVVNAQLMSMYEEDPVISLNSNNDWHFSRINTWLREKILSCIGPLDWEGVKGASRFGPGASTRIGGTKTSAYEKFSGTPHTTRGALPYLLAISEEWDNFPHKFLVVPGSSVTFVPKNAKTMRPIAIEPCMNQFVQLGIGKEIQSRLKRFGVDIRDQTRNQQLAFQGSVYQTHCTVDMKSASSLVSRMAVALLLPDDWLEVMQAFRSRTYTLDDSVGTFEMFSSMGNGFTFPLQTLLFWALACLACKMSNVGSSQVSVYGDDVIVPPHAYEVFLRLLNLYGLEPNSEKSYASGPFRESCGKDYFNGWDCQPLYLKEPILEGLELVKFANRLRRLSIRSCNGHGCDKRFQALWQYCVSQLPRELRTSRIPEGYGDGGLVTSFEEACPQRAPHSADGKTYAGWVPLGVEGFIYKRWVFLPDKYEMVDEMGTLRYALFTAERIQYPARGWMVNGRTPDSSHVEIRDKEFDTFRDFDASLTDPKGHVKATHRKKGRYERREGVARNWPSLGGWI